MSSLLLIIILFPCFITFICVIHVDQHVLLFFINISYCVNIYVICSYLGIVLIYILMIVVVIIIIIII